LPAEDDLPDAVFVEDVALVLDEVAVMTRRERRRGGRKGRRSHRPSVNTGDCGQSNRPAHSRAAT